MIASAAATAGVPAELGGSLLAAYLENPQQWNRYSYVLNNPLPFVDPLGHEPQGHHLFSGWRKYTGLAREFTKSIKTGTAAAGVPKSAGIQHTPERSGFRSLASGAGAERLGLPSASRRGTFLSGKSVHCAAAGSDTSTRAPSINDFCMDSRVFLRKDATLTRLRLTN